MSVMRIHKTKNYTVMSNHHFKERNMSLKAKGLLSLMLSLPDDWNYSVAGLVKLSKDGKDSVMSALSELEKYGYLYRVKLTNDKGQFSGIEYNIFEEPQQEIPVAVMPISAKEDAAKGDADKPPQSNTKILNTVTNKIIYDINNYIHLLETIPNDRVRNLYVDFLEHRNRIGDVLTVRGFELLIERVRELAGLNEDKQIELLRTALINNWKNVYPAGQQEQQPPEGLDELKRFYS